MQNNLNRADKAAGNVSRSTGKIYGNMSRLGSVGFNLSNLAAGVYLLKNAASAISGLMEQPDSLNAIQYRLGTYDTTNATAISIRRRIFSSYKLPLGYGKHRYLAAVVLATGATGGAAHRLSDLPNCSIKRLSSVARPRRSPKTLLCSFHRLLRLECYRVMNSALSENKPLD
jgi:hypothetical protein